VGYATTPASVGFFRKPQVFLKAVAEHQAASSAFDVVSYAPSWIGDLANSGVLELLDPCRWCC
jgi:hypothetical protein